MSFPGSEFTRMNWKLTLVMGVVMILGGVIALLDPFIATLTALAIASAAFFIVGAMQLWLAFRSEDGSSGARAIVAILGVLMIVFAFSLMFQPFAGLISLTMLVAAFFLAAGLVRIWLAFRMRHRRRWGWLLASGLLSAFLGVLIFLGLPGAALSVLGLLLGIELLFSGSALVALALAARD